MEGETFQTFSSPSKDRAGSENKMQEVTLPAAQNGLGGVCFCSLLTELLLNILTMINSGLGLFLLHVSLAISSSVCLFPKEPLCCFAGKPRPRKLNVLRGSRGGEQSSSLPALQLGWDPNHPRAGGRCRQGAAEQTQLLVRAVAFTGTPRRHKPVISALCKIPFGRLLPAELSHLPLGHPELPKPVYGGSTDLKAESHVSYKAKIHFRQTQRQRSITNFHPFTTNLFVFLNIYFSSFSSSSRWLLKNFVW